MGRIFVSHVEEDAETALAIADGLNDAGYQTWCYERDALPGPSYLLQTARQIESSRAVVLLISPDSLGSHQVTAEVVRAHESARPFIPVLVGISHVEFAARQPEWREALGSATSISLPDGGVPGILSRIVSGLQGLGVDPDGGSDEVERPPVYTVAPRSVPVASDRRAAVGRRNALIGGGAAVGALLVVAIVAIAALGGGGGKSGQRAPTVSTIDLEEAGTASPPTSVEAAASEGPFKSAADTPVATSAGGFRVADAAVTTKTCPPAGIPGSCLTATGSDRYVLVHLVPAGGGRAAMTQVFAIEANQSSLSYGSGRQAGNYSVYLDEAKNRIEVVYGVVPADAVGGKVLLRWPGNEALLLSVSA